MKMDASVPLWKQLRVSAKIVQSVLQGQSIGVALEASPKDLRAGVQALSFAALRHLGVAQVLLSALVHRQPDGRVRALLLCSLALLEANCAQSDSGVVYETFTLVAQSVEVAKRDVKMRFAAGMVNACLRRYLRERDTLLQSANQDESQLALLKWGHPLWWVQLLQAQYLEYWGAIVLANRTQAPLHLRVNAMQMKPLEYVQKLKECGLEAQRVGPTAVQLEQTAAVADLPGFAQGWVSVQDAGAQVAAPLLLNAIFLSQQKDSETKKNYKTPTRWRVLDACAAPGGKTTHLLEYANANKQAVDLLALDIDAKRCERIVENLERLRLRTQAQVLAADAAKPSIWWDRQLLDAILLDAPCTASGIARRHPDVLWLRRHSDIGVLAQRQMELLSALWPLLKPGGYLLYATCSVFFQEGKKQIEAFINSNSDVLLVQQIQLLPQAAFFLAATDERLSDNVPLNHDGFYYALLRKADAYANTKPQNENDNS